MSVEVVISTSVMEMQHAQKSYVIKLFHSYLFNFRVSGFSLGLEWMVLYHLVINSSQFLARTLFSL